MTFTEYRTPLKGPRCVVVFGPSSLRTSRWCWNVTRQMWCEPVWQQLICLVGVSSMDLSMPHLNRSVTGVVDTAAQGQSGTQLMFSSSPHGTVTLVTTSRLQLHQLRDNKIRRITKCTEWCFCFRIRYEYFRQETAVPTPYTLPSGVYIFCSYL
jgi:hypothetical protein